MRMIVGIIVCVRMFVDVRMIASCISTLVREAVADCAKVPDMAVTFGFLQWESSFSKI